MAKQKKAELSYCTGTLNEAREAIERSLKIYLGRYRKVKIGITGREPQVRYKEHLMDRDWSRMVVKYKSTSQNNVNKLEDYFIEKYPRLKNQWIGQSILSEKGPNYLYFLLNVKIRR
jgi:hypothetical protein